MAEKYEDDSISKVPVSVNGYRISYSYPTWKATKNGAVVFSDKNKAKVISWAEQN